MTSKNDIQQESYLKTWINWWIYKSNNTELELDVPVKRFLVVTGYYLIFVFFLMLTILDHTEFKLIFFRKSDSFSANYIVLSIFVVSSLWQDVYCFFSHRSFTSYFKFWRVYDFVMHLGLMVALCLRISHLSIDEKTESYLSLQRAEGDVFAIVSTSALLR